MQQLVENLVGHDNAFVRAASSAAEIGKSAMTHPADFGRPPLLLLGAVAVPLGISHIGAATSAF
jgi:hypothetical protein